MRVRLQRGLAAILSILTALTLSPAARSGAQQSAPTVQSIFVGARDCSDNWYDCSYGPIIPEHRYLHVVLWDAPNNDDWQVQAGPECSPDLPVVAGGQPTSSTGYLEVVIDLQSASGAQALSGRSGCYVFRGRNHWAVGYYAAYFDDSPAFDLDQVYPRYRAMGERPDLPDLDVTYIHRSPTYAYDAHPNAPPPGTRVTFTAHVVNAGGEPSPAAPVSWWLDGRRVGAGTLASLPPDAGHDVSFLWKWGAEPHDLEFRLQPVGPEISTSNDRLSVRTDALTLGFWIERGAYDYFRQQQWRYCQELSCSGSDSFEDWLQRQVAAWNRLLGRSVYPGVDPAGIADRVRVDSITIVPNGSLPLHGGLSTNNPDSDDHTVDLQWGLPAQNIQRIYHGEWEGSFDLDWSLIHELNHARSLADLYRFDIPLRQSNVISVRAGDGRPAFDPAQPYSPDNKIRVVGSALDQPFLYQDRENDLMACPCSAYYSPYSALVLNRLRGRRARCGNANPPCNLGDWYLDIPPVNRVRLLDRHARPVPDGSLVRLFFDGASTYNDHVFTDANSETLIARRGEISLSSDPFRTHGSTYAAGRNLLLVEVQASGRDVFCFQEPTDLNLAYWEGYRDWRHPAVYTLRVGGEVENGCDLRLPPARLNEPFATSPFRSTVTVARTRGPNGRPKSMVTVTLLDDARPAHAMRNRRVVVEDAKGRRVGQATTNARGIARVLVPRTVRGLQVNDVTDNNLAITAPS